VTGDEVIVVDLAPFGRFHLAAILREGTARMEFTARRRVDWARNFAFKLDRRFFRIRIEVRNGRQQRLGARPETGSGP
jgi:predicted ATP-grasp superfamily ATP-dependent carboligase